MATENDKVNTGALGTLVTVGLFATLSIALAVTALVRYSVEGVRSERASLAEKDYYLLRQAQQAQLEASPAWTDKGKGLVSMPIDRAKSKVLADLARDPASASPPPPPPAEPAATGEVLGQPAPSGEPAPSAAPAAPAPTTAALDKKPAAPPPAGTVASAKPAAPAATPEPPPAPAPAAPAPAAPKPTDG